MNDIRWLRVDAIIYDHDSLVNETGGSLGVRDMGALESSVARPKQLAHYQPESDIFNLAASLGFGLVKNHCFVDGNKRTALSAMYAFLDLNNVFLDASEADAVFTMVAVATGELTEADLSQWLKDNC